MKREAQRPGSSEITTVGLYTYYWFSMSDAYLKGVAVKISNQLQSLVIEVTLVDDLVLHVYYFHVCSHKIVKLKRCSAPNSTVLDQVPLRAHSLSLGNLNATAC